MGVKFTNNAETTLSSGINNSVTSISVASSSTFPSISGSNYFYATLDDGTNNEVVKVTAISGTTWTVTRAQDDTTARAFSSGDTVELRLNVALLEDALGDAATFARDSFTGDGSTYQFTLSQTAASENNLIVFIEGVFQTQSAYSLSGTTLDFGDGNAPAANREIIVYSTQALSAGTVVTASIVDDNVTQAKIADDAVGADQLASSAVVTASIVDDNVTQAKIADDAVGADQLASSAVVTASIVDDAVTTAKIADDQVTLAKMAGLARGKIIYGDSSGNPAALAVGSNGQILKSDGTDISWGTDSGAITALNNATANELVTVGSTTTELDAEANLTFDGSALQVTGTLTVGVDDTGHDVKFFGATASKYMLWDESADSLIVKDVVDAVNFKVNGGQGSDGQVLTSTGSGVAWEAVSAGPTFKTFGTDSIMVGDSTTGTINAANYNTALGVDAFNAIDEGDFNTAVGWGAGKGITTGHRGTFIGAGTGYQNAVTADGNTCIGNEAGHYINSGASNTFVGYGAGKVVVSGGENVAIGKDAYLAGTASNNVVVGADAMKSTTSGTQQVAVGKAALQLNDGGNYNTAVGAYAGQDCASGEHNVFVGWSAGKDVTANNNTIIGSEAGDEWTGNGNNVAIGHHAAETSGTTCNLGVWIGYECGATEAIDGNKAGQVVIGAQAQIGNHENLVAIGKSCPGQGNNTVTFGKSASSKVNINWDTGTAWTYPSDERMKENIADMPASAGLSFIKSLKPRTFTWRKVEDYDESLTSLGGTMKIAGDKFKKAEGTQYGFVAQEVKTAMEGASITPNNDGGGYGFWTQAEVGNQQGVAKEDLIPSLVKAIQELEARLAALESE